MDAELRAFMMSFNKLADLAEEFGQKPNGAQLAPVLEKHLKVSPSSLPLITEAFGSHRLADANIALDRIAGSDPSAKIVGIAGQQRYHADLADLLMPENHMGIVGEPSYASLAVGPDQQRRFLTLGIHLFHYHSSPLAVLIRKANPEYGKPEAALEILSPDEQVTDAFLKEFRNGLRTSSIFKGQVISFKGNEYQESNAGVAFHRREPFPREQLVLPDGLRERIEEQVLGVGTHRDVLTALGAHLKRGVLLYGPPGTGKTHTVRYLASAAEDHTVILLNGDSLAYISQAAAMARALQPSIVVLEDCDLIAEDRSFSHGPQPLLFEVLDTMDGLEPDADVTFLLTTNRVDSLERALVQRPGRIDLAVEIPRPDLEGRIALLELYAAKLKPSSDTVQQLAHLVDGTTASFTRELVRRSILNAAVANQAPGDAHLLEAAAELMGDAATLTRNFLGGTNDPDLDEPEEFSEDASFGWFPGVAGSYEAPSGFGQDPEAEQDGGSKGL